MKEKILNITEQIHSDLGAKLATIKMYQDIYEGEKIPKEEKEKAIKASGKLIDAASTLIRKLCAEIEDVFKLEDAAWISVDVALPTINDAILMYDVKVRTPKGEGICSFGYSGEPEESKKGSFSTVIRDFKGVLNGDDNPIVDWCYLTKK